MAETTQVVVPLQGAQVNNTPQPTRERPTWAAKSLHAVKFPRQEVELEPRWEMNGPSPEVKWQPVEQRAEQSPTRQYTQPYQQQVNYMEQDQPGGQQPQEQHAPQLPQAPDPLNYDFYDPAETARFHQDNRAYMRAEIDAGVQRGLQPHMSALQEAELRRDYNAAVERYGEDANFKDVMNVALEQCAEAAKAGKRFSITEAYQAANDKSAARPGQRGNAHLPEAFRDKRRGIGMLGRIMHHNQQTGRSKR